MEIVVRYSDFGAIGDGEADELWRSSGMKDNAIVLFNKDWHIGIVGIVASKFVEKYYKPAFIMTYQEEE